jgi:hypothetical protein
MMHSDPSITVRQAARTVRRILVRESDSHICRTVADEWQRVLSPDAVISADPVASPSTESTVTIGISGGPGIAGRLVWKEGNAFALHATHCAALYPLFTMVAEEYAGQPVTSLANGLSFTPAFPWMRNLNDFLVGSLRTARGFDRESFIRQLARAGYTHVSVNGLGVPQPFETSPPGDVYHWFYDYSPDLDQFVDSALLSGYYPAEYLRANLRFLLDNAALARKYGLVPGLHINSPRSMPEAFWEKYGYLRGARVDHPRETLRPRYSLAMAHPMVQRHYRELMRNILKEVPDLGFIHVWTNDSGAGFEFVSSLYAGRNGGPYLIREWKGDDVIARAAAGNAMTYYRLLRDEGRRVNPEFHVVCDLAPFFAERKYIIPELGNGIDAGDFAYFEEQPGSPAREAIEATGALVHIKLDLCDNNVLGVPSPYLVLERLNEAHQSGAMAVLSNIAPLSLVPYDINAAIVRAFQCGMEPDIEQVLLRHARAWGGPEFAGLLMVAWSLSDKAVRSYPSQIPISTFGFPWFRLWVRPFVPDIDCIPEAERAYYEKFLLATFNNPARVDLNNDMMWNFVTVEQAGALKQRVDEMVIPPLDQAIDLFPSAGSRSPMTPPVIDDQRDRLVAARCFYTTMRNTMAWTESVHGYLEATTPEERERCRTRCGDMVKSELLNTRTLLATWERSETQVIPISSVGESLHVYGENFGELLKRKIALMEQHAQDEPHIDPEYMWRLRSENAGPHSDV